MADNKQSPAVRKRQQITRANQMMFLAVAGVSVVVGFSVVLIVFLVQHIWFGERILSEKLNTVSVLEKNIKIAPELKDNVRVLNTNQNLMSTRLKDSDPAIQSVLDALPADANSAAMAASLQNKLLSGVPGVTIESLKIEPVSGVETSTTSSASKSSSTSKKKSTTTKASTSSSIKFSFSVSTTTNKDGLRQVLTQLEKSIRPFTVTVLTVESQGNRVVMTTEGLGYYSQAQEVQLKEKVVRP
jgi:cell division septation protein DedD